MTQAAAGFPDIDARTQDCITDEQAQFFRDHGLLLIRGVLGDAELGALQRETQPLIDKALTRPQDEPWHTDCVYRKHPATGSDTPFRIEYVIDKTRAGKALLGHPFILRSIEKLQGPSFLPTWDSMVFKLGGQGAEIPWHRDSKPYEAADIDHAVAAINVDFYLDPADQTNCLWGIPGSNRWTKAQAAERIAQLQEGGFHTDADCVPIPMRPGDVLFHSILVLHGSPAAQSQLRRVVYYEFRPCEVELRYGPHKPEYIPVKQKLLQACLEHRRQTPYAAGEKPFVYKPEAKFAPPAFNRQSEPLPTYRFAHGDYWRR